jgi:hypothetical protein
MPLQNRVGPNGEIFTSPARGTFLGNRGGVMHNDHRQLVRPYAGRRWLICLLSFKGRQRTVMSPGLYTELFFLDEAVALAAGHRPCAECRRDRFNAFREAWLAAGNPRGGGPAIVDIMDRELHRTRISSRKEKLTYEAPLDSLPDGCFVRIDSDSYLLHAGVLLKWSPEGYREKLHLSKDSTVSVLTPEPIVRCLLHGYKPALHESA